MMTAFHCEVGTPSADAARPRPLATTILRLIWEAAPLSRADIARRLEVSRSTVSEIVEALLPTGLIEEAGTGESRGGRRPIVLRFRDDAYTLLGVDVGASHVSVVAMNLRGTVRVWQTRPHGVQDDPAGTRTLVQALCDACLSVIDLQASPLIGIGVALPSPIDPRHPERVSRLALGRWNGVHGFDVLGERYRVPVLLDNDANLGALAEHWWGAARGLADFTYVKIATGIGAGHFIGGRIYRGAGGVAGEIGHVTIDEHGHPCVCGNRGCLTTYVGTQQLADRVRALLPEYPRSALHASPISTAAIAAAAHAGDPLASRVVQEAAEHIGTVVAGMLNLMNPAVVVFGGSLCQLREDLLRPIREAVVRRTFVSAVASSEIVMSALGERGVAIGAATLVLDAVLSDPHGRLALFPPT
jgi:predicted NBD/HSP70 family sugar kinase